MRVRVSALLDATRYVGVDIDTIQQLVTAVGDNMNIARVKCNDIMMIVVITLRFFELVSDSKTLHDQINMLCKSLRANRNGYSRLHNFN